MGPRPRIPPELMRRPFSLAEARAAGVSRTSLRGKAWRRIGTELYCWSGLHDDPWTLLAAWRNLLPPEAVFAGPSAAWLHGIDLDPIHPIEIVVPSTSGVRSRVGLRVRRSDLARREAVEVRGLPATTVTRTLADLCCDLPAVEALVAMDAALRLRLSDIAVLARGGTRKLRRLAMLAEPTESPMETRLRWLLVQAGLPRPEVQKNLHDVNGRFVGRADMFYASARLVIEYDGTNHRDRLVDDNRRQNLMTNAGYRMLRFTAADVIHRPDAVIAHVRSALAAAHGDETPQPRVVVQR